MFIELLGIVIIHQVNFTNFSQDKPYPMLLPNLGHAVIINNVVDEMPGSMEDIQALKTTRKWGSMSKLIQDALPR